MCVFESREINLSKKARRILFLLEGRAIGSLCLARSLVRAPIFDLADHIL